jgi:hypothetical protein
MVVSKDVRLSIFLLSIYLYLSAPRPAYPLPPLPLPAAAGVKPEAAEGGDVEMAVSGSERIG